MADTSFLAIATNIFTAPSEAFAALKERPRVLLPVLLFLVCYSAVSFVYMKSVDIGWFLETQMRAGNAALTDEQITQAVNAATRISPTVYGALGAVSSSFFIFLVLFLSALYYTGASFVTGDGIKLKQWFALVCWTWLPTVLGVIAQIVNLSINDARFMLQDAINPLSFGNLLSIDRAGATILQRVLLGIDITAIWAVVLAVMGYQAFTKSSIVKAAAVVLGPLVVIVLIGTLLALR